MTILLLVNKSVETNNSMAYLVGATVAVLILAYLLYSLVKPEKF